MPDNIGNESILPPLLFARDDRDLAHQRMPAQHGLDFARLDAIASDFHLLVDASEKIEVAVREPAHEIAALVETRARVAAERIRNELFGSQLRTIKIAARQANAADVQFAGHADRDR